MIIKEFDVVELKDGRSATIVDVTAQGEQYEADVGDTTETWKTITIKQNDIAKIK